MLWKATAALLLGAVLAVGSSAFIAWRSLQQFKRADFAEDVLEATRSGAITRCGEALCARVGDAPRKYGRAANICCLSRSARHSAPAGLWVPSTRRTARRAIIPPSSPIANVSCDARPSVWLPQPIRWRRIQRQPIH